MNPYILSVSRKEDIPAFKPEWFINTLKEGSISLLNYGNEYTVYFDKLKFIVFWSKNPKPLIQYLKDIPYKYYFQFTLNDYKEYELNVPELDERIETFKNLALKIGTDKVIWRYDPIIINNKITIVSLLKKIEYIGNKINTYTNKFIFSFIDNYIKLNNQFNKISNTDMNIICKEIIQLNKSWNLELSTCAEEINYKDISHNSCIDANLIRKICGNQRWISNSKDKNQRILCNCIKSVDIGKYKECKHNCLYCYAK